MTLGNTARLVVVLAAVTAAVGSASSNQNQNQSMIGGYGQAEGSAPPPQAMEPARALGLWRSTFGAVKIEADNSRGGLQTGSVQGVWVYQRQGQEVVGYFSGNLRGNVLQFKWQEPSNPPLTGDGYLVFDQQGRQYSGRWWSDRRDRVGAWNGWRNGGQADNGNGAVRDPYSRNPDDQYGNGGQQYGNGQPYGPQNGQYGGQPYAGRVPTYAPRGPQRPQQPPQPQPQPYGPQPTPPTYY